MTATRYQEAPRVEIALGGRVSDLPLKAWLGVEHLAVDCRAKTTPVNEASSK